MNSRDQGIVTIDPEFWRPSDTELKRMEQEQLLVVSGHEDEPIYHFKCVRSGACCRTNLCGRGEMNTETNQCTHLILDETLQEGVNLYRCNLYSLYNNKNDGSAMQFGKGCCAPWNEARAKVIEQYRLRQLAITSVTN
ncbi:hypothetical protein J8Z24_21445 (plasmid) [Pseudoalteromonas sp. SCSIO 43201]|uniref:hypothetical protein n=1 Tax=Pseudoalteromonas sp. SCSIO 43201 TaxID=2822842 RepID=UPI0020754D4D|nr:hypothetical protein [Pseudoalteromonas sp. SCSIO 43201]USD31182.1 hypothetical protein J8Z24_21445 [Pseudoalteromonas sp. SCSIO 43201]